MDAMQSTSSPPQYLILCVCALCWFPPVGVSVLCQLVVGTLSTMLLLLVIAAIFRGFTLTQKFTLDAVKGDIQLNYNSDCAVFQFQT
jgi:hypothetical protein